MCGRFILTLSYEDQLALVRLEEEQRRLESRPRWNIAPGQEVAAVGIPETGGKRKLVGLRWGLVPSWSKERSPGSRLINARRETVDRKPTFREAFRQRRCLILADGFYEWQNIPTGTWRGYRSQPWLFTLADRRGFCFAGLWDAWRRPDGSPLYTCAILTTHANRLMAPVHDRMPVIVDRQDQDAWLTARHDDPVLKSITEPFPDDRMEAYEVSEAVNDPKHDEPDCVDPKPGPGKRGRVDPDQGVLY